MAKDTIRPLYSCVAHIAGSRDNSVFLPSVTAAEIAVLRVLHGNGHMGAEPVINIKPTGKGVDRSDNQERARIVARYRSSGKHNGATVLNSLYGVGNPLPLEYEAAARSVEDTEVPVPENERIVNLEPEGPISSVPEEPPAESPKKTKKAESLLDD